ncbi:MAG: uridine phosphorylase [Candidatus Hadarchaeum sp.]
MQKRLVSGKEYHIGVALGEVARYVLLPGDPARAELIAKKFDEAKEVAYNREFRTFTGKVDGIPISVTSTGIGGPSAAIAVEELARCGADTFIRVGTAGALGKNVKVGDIVIAQAAVREEGTSQQYVPLSYPAVADLEVTNALIKSAKNLGIRYHLGVVVSKDAFYAEEPGRVPLSKQAEELWGLWRRAQVLATEMECATIFTVAGVNGWRSGGVLAIIGPVGKIVRPLPAVENAIKVAVDAVKILAKDR